MGHRLFVILMTCLCLSPAFAVSVGNHEGRLMSRSTSGKTIVINLGTVDGINAMDYGVLLKQVADLKANQLRMVPVAKGRVIKVSGNRSLWVLYRFFDMSLLGINDDYLVLTESQLMDGRGKLDAGRMKMVTERSFVKSGVKHQLTHERTELARKSDTYRKFHKNHESTEQFSKKAQLTDIDTWKSTGKSGDSEVKYASEIYRSPYAKDFSDRKRVETFEKMVVNYLKKVNDPDFDYERFYMAQTKDPMTNEFREQATVESEYMAILDAESRRKNRDAILYKQLLEKGEGWSDDYSDEELGKLLNKVGVVYEKERRHVIMSEASEFQFIGNLGMNLLDNENRADQQNSRSAKWGLGVGMEYFPFTKGHRLQRLSAETSFRFVQDGVSLGNNNAQSTEYSFAAGLNWYPWMLPHVVNQNIIYFGVGLRTGIVKLAVPSQNNLEGNYGMTAFPSITAGLKYQFRSGYGLRVTLSMEQLKLDRIESNTPGSILPARTEILDGRLGFGVTKFF